MTVHEVSSLAGVSVRTLHYYDQIGVLPAAEITEAGYRLYDEPALERLQQILLFRELQFSLKEIKDILADPDFDRNEALEQQIHLLELRKERLQKLIDLAREIQTTGERNMNFDAFDTKKIEEYETRAKAAWGHTDAYKEYERKSADRGKETQQQLNRDMMDIFREFGKIRMQAPTSAEAATLVKKLQGFINANYYNCTDNILLSLGEMYAAGGEFTENIDRAGGPGTAIFASNAIRSVLGKAE